MKLTLNAFAGAALVLLSLPSGASAATVISQPLATPTPTIQYSLVGGQQEASQFTLGSTTSITGATFYGAALSGPIPSIFTIQFYSSHSNPNPLLGNLPLAELYNSNTTASSYVSAGVNDNLGAAVQLFSVNFAPFTALAGVDYFFAASDLAVNGYNFGVETSSTGVGAQTGNGIAGFYALRTSEAFSLTADGATNGAVPEPATWAMMLLGFGAIGFGMRRRSRVLVQQAA